MNTKPTVSNLGHREWYTGDRYLNLHPTWFVHEATWKADQVFRMIERNGLHPRSVVDIGCGAGRVLAALQPNLNPTCELQGYDIAPAAIAMAEAAANDRLHFAVADVTSLADVRADLTLVMDVIDNLEDPFAFLRTIKPIGRSVILHLGLNLSVQRVLREGGLRARRDVGEVNFYSKDLVFALLRDTGFEIKDFFYTGMALDLNDVRGRLDDGSEERPPIHWRNFVLRGPRRALFRVNPDVAVRLLGGYHLMVLAEQSPGDRRVA